MNVAEIWRNICRFLSGPSRSPGGNVPVRIDDRIPGFAALGVEASELLAVQTAMLRGMLYQTLRDTIFTHPTISEGFHQLFANLSPAT
ncbi:MAG: Dihydrolipoyl dehydrogenase [Chthoniobacteraceae bacterium]|nr:Dihydrolipoyl dehydrogenase [Chthoniobacteraceae bacterium]